MAAAIAVAIAEGRSGPDAARHVLQARGAPRSGNLGTIVVPGCRRWPDDHPDAVGGDAAGMYQLGSLALKSVSAITADRRQLRKRGLDAHAT